MESIQFRLFEPPFSSYRDDLISGGTVITSPPFGLNTSSSFRLGPSIKAALCSTALKGEGNTRCKILAPRLGATAVCFGRATKEAGGLVRSNGRRPDEVTLIPGRMKIVWPVTLLPLTHWQSFTNLKLPRPRVPLLKQQPKENQLKVYYYSTCILLLT